MNKTLRPRRRAFTLIELLTVIAVIGILASILIPTVGAARKAANKAKTKAQFVGWANALQNFKSTYGYYPDLGGFSGADDATLSLSSTANSTAFIEALSGRNTTNGNTVTTGGNRRAASFYSFAEGEFLADANGNISDNRLADAFNNPNIVIVVDKNNDGVIEGLPDPDGTGTVDVRTKVAIYSDTDDYPDGEEVYSWE